MNAESCLYHTQPRLKRRSFSCQKLCLASSLPPRSCSTLGNCTVWGAALPPPTDSAGLDQEIFVPGPATELAVTSWAGQLSLKSPLPSVPQPKRAFCSLLNTAQDLCLRNQKLSLKKKKKVSTLCQPILFQTLYQLLVQALSQQEQSLCSSHCSRKNCCSSLSFASHLKYLFLLH